MENGIMEQRSGMIDAMLISHDHYDHLDYGSIKALNAKTKEFYVPLGVGAHHRAWGIEETRIHEMDWWDEADLGSLHFAFTPSRHFSGRSISDRFATLWGSWGHPRQTGQHLLQRR